MKFRAVRNYFFWYAQVWVDTYNTWHDVPNTEAKSPEAALLLADKWENEI